MKINRDLGNGLLLRQSTEADAERIADFNSRIHGDDPHDGAAVAAWTRDLLRKPPPLVSPNDFILVEDTKTCQIVSSMDLISQTWCYEGIPFGVGRPELVGTDPDYRNRGLVRKQFEVVHEWSRQRGELVQVITGIPYFYRQFGYEMGLDLGGGRAGYFPQLPRLKEGQEEPYFIRKAVEADLPLIMKLYQRECTRSMIYAVRDETTWHNELFEKSRENVNRYDFCVIETRDARPVGYLAAPWFAWGTNQVATGYALDEGISYLSVTPVVLRYLWQKGQVNAVERGKTLDTFGLWLGRDHPAYDVATGMLVHPREPYAYYVRVPDLPEFLRRIAPVLEKRLDASNCPGYSGELKLSFYRDGVRLVFEGGKIASIESWKPTVADGGMAAFPNLTFLQLLFGYRSLEEIRYAYADCWAKDEARALLGGLFPKKRSSVWAIS